MFLRRMSKQEECQQRRQQRSDESRMNGALSETDNESKMQNSGFFGFGCGHSGSEQSESLGKTVAYQEGRGEARGERMGEGMHDGLRQTKSQRRRSSNSNAKGKSSAKAKPKSKANVNGNVCNRRKNGRNGKAKTEVCPGDNEDDSKKGACIFCDTFGDSKEGTRHGLCNRCRQKVDSRVKRAVGQKMKGDWKFVGGEFTEYIKQHCPYLDKMNGYQLLSLQEQISPYLYLRFEINKEYRNKRKIPWILPDSYVHESFGEMYDELRQTPMLNGKGYAIPDSIKHAEKPAVRQTLSQVLTDKALSLIVSFGKENKMIDSHYNASSLAESFSSVQLSPHSHATNTTHNGECHVPAAREQRSPQTQLYGPSGATYVCPYPAQSQSQPRSEDEQDGHAHGSEANRSHLTKHSNCSDKTRWTNASSSHNSNNNCDHVGGSGNRWENAPSMMERSSGIAGNNNLLGGIMDGTFVTAPPRASQREQQGSQAPHGQVAHVPIPHVEARALLQSRQSPSMMTQMFLPQTVLPMAEKHRPRSLTRPSVLSTQSTNGAHGTVATHPLEMARFPMDLAQGTQCLSPPSVARTWNPPLPRAEEQPQAQQAQPPRVQQQIVIPASSLGLNTIGHFGGPFHELPLTPAVQSVSGNRMFPRNGCARATPDACMDNIGSSLPAFGAAAWTGAATEHVCDYLDGGSQFLHDCDDGLSPWVNSSMNDGVYAAQRGSDQYTHSLNNMMTSVDTSNNLGNSSDNGSRQLYDIGENGNNGVRFDPIGANNARL